MPTAEARSRVGGRLRERWEEIELALWTRAGVFSLDENVDPEYALGLRESVSVALEYGISCIESSEATLPPLPPALYAQARLAARNGIAVETVTERYVAGNNLLDVFLEEAARVEGLVGSKALREIRQVSSVAIERLVADIGGAYGKEARRLASAPAQSRVEQIRSLLEGGRIDLTQFSYDFSGFHVGLVARGSAAEALEVLAKELDCVTLSVEPGDATTWAWLGRRKPIEIDRIGKLVDERWPGRAAIAIGEPGQNLAGWRLTHEQAKTALLVSLKRNGDFFRYGDDPLLVAALRDPLLDESLRRIYLNPIKAMPKGETQVATLRAYLAANGNGESAAAALGVKRQTVAHRVKQVEKALGQTVADRAAEIGTALRIDELERLGAIAAA